MPGVVGGSMAAVTFSRKLVAEFLGTGTLVIAALVCAIGHISGCQINPAATLALAVSKRMPWSEVPGYMLARFLGAIAGAFAIWGTLGAAGLKAGLGSLSFASPVTPGQAFFVELLGTF